MTLTEFLLARIADTIAEAGYAQAELVTAGEDQRGLPYRLLGQLLAECEAKRRIIEWHKAWPVLAETEPTFEQDGDDPQSTTLRMSKQIAWLTEQEYRKRFGVEPPTGPILRLLALPYADHPEYQEEWRP